YTSLFAVVPLVTLLVSVLSLFPSFQVFGSQVQDMIYDRLLPGTSSQLEQYISSFASQARNLTWVGLVILMTTAYLMLVNIERVFNEIWGVGEVRKGLSSFLLYWSVLSLGPLLLGIGIGISSYVTSLSLFEAFTEVSASVGVNSFILDIVPIIFTALGFTLLYVAVPNCSVTLRHGFVGGLVVAIAFVLVKKLFTWFISVASFEFVYGAFAAMPIFLFWIYICWVVILFGANLVRGVTLFQTQHQMLKVHPTLLMLALLHKFWSRQQEGRGVKISELGDEHWPFRSTQIEEFLDLLSEHKVIKACTEAEYVLSRDLQTITLFQILNWLPWPHPQESDFQGQLPDCVARHLPAFSVLQSQFQGVQADMQKTFADDLNTFFRQHQDNSVSVGSP
ncbi:MAG: YihY family inner membrane protein, partial [Pseudohongiellaceae bacterium]